MENTKVITLISLMSIKTCKNKHLRSSPNNLGRDSLKQTTYQSIIANINMISRWYSRKTRHTHDITSNRN